MAIKKSKQNQKYTESIIQSQIQVYVLLLQGFDTFKTNRCMNSSIARL